MSCLNSFIVDYIVYPVRLGRIYLLSDISLILRILSVCFLTKSALSFVSYLCVPSQFRKIVCNYVGKASNVRSILKNS